MLKRVFSTHTLWIIEAGLIGLFFVQALRFLIGMLYSHVASIASLSEAAITPDELTGEITLLVYMLALPLLTLVLGRVRPVLVIAAGLVAVGRALMNADLDITPTTASMLAVGGGLVYIAMIVRWRAQILPYMFVLGLGADQVFRAVGNTLDPSWSPGYFGVQVALSILVMLLSVVNLLTEREAERGAISPDYGLLPLWGGVGLAGLLYLELALLALPNAVASRANVDYTVYVPALVAATLLPLLPAVRGAARGFIGLFDGTLRGWAWMLVIALLIVLGTRLRGLPAGAALVAAQFLVSLSWWWLARPRAEKERGFGGLWIVFGVGLFALLLVGDNFTYDYAFVRSFTGDFAFLNDIVPPLLRGFRGLGLGLLLFAVFLAILPVTQSPRRIPWTGGSGLSSALLLLLVIGASAGAAFAAQPPVVTPSADDDFRVGTYNIHSGFDEAYRYRLDDIARIIGASGADVVLLQEIETGRVTSFGVDQPLWLARTLGMDRRFFPTNEGLQGLAVLSRVPIPFDDGVLLSSIGSQTGVQRVQLQPEQGVVITVYNTWLSPLLEIEGGVAPQEQEQARQLNELFGIIASHHPGGVLGRTVIGGTFHNVPDAPLIDQLRQAGFIDPFAGLPVEIGATFVRTGLPRARFDYLWLRNLSPLGAGVMDSDASDHRMAVTGVLINRLPGA
jgi:endonuclease/exonuclease/phosphatase (EEP) superfamily protein YafD